MSNSRKTIWLLFALVMFIQVGSSYIIYKNQNNLSFLMEMKGYIPYLLFFSLAVIVLFLFSFMVYQLDGMKAKKHISQLENDKNELKAKLFDMQEAQTKEKLPSPITKPETPPALESPTNPEEEPE